MDLKRINVLLPDAVDKELPEVISKFEINTPLRLAHFLAQCAHESGEFRRTKENLNYSAERLVVIFPKYFSDKTAKLYAKKPEKIANVVYANRMGNGTVESGDGFKYSGKGYIQLTGKTNYKAFSDAFGVDCVEDPSLVSTKYPLTSAAWFFKSAGILKVCDLGSSLEVVTKVTKKVNGGTIGLEDRYAKFKDYLLLLS